MRTDLFVIDAQNDFCTPNGALFVPGADEDCVRLANMINRLGKNIHSIHLTLDSHNEIDIAHPVMWKDKNGNNPNPFTIITKDQVKNGEWTTVRPQFLARALEYVTKLEENGRFPLCIWPPHCIIGTNGHALEENVSNAVRDWGKNNISLPNFVTKGSNPWTEHYSALRADVPDPQDPTTLMNTPFIGMLDQSDRILVAGQALSHCVNNTIRDLVSEFGKESISKITLLTDTCSNVTGFENLGDDFVRDMTALGMKTALSTEVMA